MLINWGNFNTYIIAALDLGGGDIYCEFALTLQYGLGLYYSPLFALLYLPLCALGFLGSFIWYTLTITAGVIALRQASKICPRWLVIFIGIFAFGNQFGRNMDTLLLLGTIWLFSRKGQLGWKEGLVFGLMTAKPVIILLFPYLVYACVKGKRWQFTMGAIVTFALNWGYFALDPAKFLSFLEHLVRGDMSMDPIAAALYWYYWNYLVYPWLTYAHYYFWVIRKRLAQRGAFLQRHLATMTDSTRSAPT